MSILKNIFFFLICFSFTAANSQSIYAGTNLNLDPLLSLTPDIVEGKKIFTHCTKCHGVEGWGASNGDFPQLAGQHQRVIIKQLLDIRSGMRENPVMLPVIEELSRQGDQAIVDVAAYIETMKMDPEPEIGDSDDEVLTSAQTSYAKKCASCHGTNGEGVAEKFYPLLHGQHYEYLLRQLKNIQLGKRKNANNQMRQFISQMTDAELELLADYISRLLPPENKLAPLDD